MSAVLALLLTLLGGAVRAEEKRYSMKDLEALARSESWGELLQHLEDVPPAKRDAAWQRIAEKGALGRIGALSTDKDPLWALVTADGLTKRYPFLKKSRSFMSKRAEVGLKGFEACYEHSYSGGPCSDRFLPFVEADPGNVDFALKAGQLVIRKQHHYFAIPYFKWAVVWAKGSKKVCEASRLWDALSAAFDLPKSFKTLVPAAQDVARTCWAHVREDLEARVDKSSYWKENLCPVLKEKKSKAAAKCK